MTQQIKLARGVTLAPDAMLQRFAILAMSGAGKSNVAAVMAEQMHAAGIPWVVIDPKGDWWGLRSSKTGKAAGLDVPIFGGLHADVPLYEDGGAVMADAVAAELPHSILDVSEFDSKAAMLRFLTAFGERLYKVNRDPLMVILEEADEFIPQKTNSPEEAKSVGVWSRIVKRGRTRGIFTTLIAQRIAELAKAVLNQSDTAIVLRATAKLDRDAVKGWIEYADAAPEILTSLPTLDDGEGWLASPQKLKLTKRLHFDRRYTFDSGATPTLGESRESVKLASIDLSAIDERMQATIERAKADDPKELRAQIAELQRQLAERPAAEPAPPVEVLVLDEDAMGNLRKLLAKVDEDVAALPSLFEDLLRGIDTALTEGVREQLDRAEAIAGSNGHLTPPDESPAGRRARGLEPIRPAGSKPGRITPADAPAAADLGVVPDGPVTLKKAERTILNVLAQFPTGRTKVQVAILAGYSKTSGGFRNALGKLRGAGYMVGTDPMRITQEGLAVVGKVEPLPTGRALLEHWLNQPKMKKAERVILEILYNADRPLSKDEIAEAAEYSVTSGGFRNALGKLRSLELVAGMDPIELSEVLR